jgi:hypothetical protein
VPGRRVNRKTNELRKMEIQTTSKTERIAGNVEVLSELESEIVVIEKISNKRELLENEKSRLAAAVENLGAR